MIAQTDQVRTIRDSRDVVLAGVADEVEGQNMMLAAGQLGGFAATCSNLRMEPEGGAVITRGAADALGIRPGDSFTAIGR